MGFGGLKKPDQRANVIAYLNTLSDSPQPLPQAAEAGAKPAGGGGEKPAEGAAPAPAKPQPPGTENPAPAQGAAPGGSPATPPKSGENPAATTK
jgi:cytochrome c